MAHKLGFGLLVDLVDASLPVQVKLLERRFRARFPDYEADLIRLPPEFKGQVVSGYAMRFDGPPGKLWLGASYDQVSAYERKMPTCPKCGRLAEYVDRRQNGSKAGTNVRFRCVSRRCGHTLVLTVEQVVEAGYTVPLKRCPRCHEGFMTASRMEAHRTCWRCSVCQRSIWLPRGTLA